MKQILQNYKTGELTAADVPVPAAQRGRVLVRTAVSLISAGTERAAVDSGRKSLLGKVKERPELIKQVIQKAKQEGLSGTINAVRSKLNSPVALGYSAAGIVMEAGADVKGFRVGDRVACAGLGYASHAEVISVPQNLCAHLPDQVSFEAGACGTLGAIALQGVRLAEPTLGEAVVVIGLGLLGQLTAQLLRANGCRVFGIDLDPAKVELARALGADAGATFSADTPRVVMEWSHGRGADAVLITAATKSNEPVELAGEISRLKGRVVAVGLVGLDIPRQSYFQRELTLKVSMSYGPGRYDPEYEERGHDYPYAYVRWTEGRNIEAFLDLVAAGQINVERLITHRFSLAEGARAYQLITGETKEPYLGIALVYDTARELERTIRVKPREDERVAEPAAGVRVGLIGAGDYARAMLLPHFAAQGVDFRAVVTASGVTARTVGEEYGFARLASAPEEIISDPEINLVVIATRHDMHAELARRALEGGRYVFVEKPLSLTDEELDAVLDAAARAPGRLMVGYNRRFAPLARQAKEFFAGIAAPLSILYRVNAGRVPREHWTQDPREGGGRILGEVCHFIDLMQYWTGALPVRVYAEAIASRNHQIVDEDSVFITLRFADGSNGSIAYLAEGDAALPKERVEICGGGRSFVLEDFRYATAYKDEREQRTKSGSRQDKGQTEAVRALCAAVRAGRPTPFSLAELAATTRATFRIKESLRTGQAISLETP